MKFVQSLLVLSTILLMIACVEKEKDTTSLKITEADKRELKHMKQIEWPKAYAEQDIVLLDKILGEDFVMIDQNGNWTDKQDELDWIKKNTTQNDSFYYEIKRFDVLGKWNGNHLWYRSYFQRFNTINLSIKQYFRKTKLKLEGDTIACLWCKESKIKCSELVWIINGTSK